MLNHIDVPAVTIAGLVKSYGGTPAVSGINLSVPRGQVVGLVGPNGAGKTTTLRIVAALVAPDAGSVRVFGHDVRTDPDDVRRRTGVTGESGSIDEELTGWQNLVRHVRLRGLAEGVARRRVGELVEELGLTEAAHRRAGDYSGGVRRRLELALALVVAPDLLILDDPATGLDPRSRRAAWNIIRDLTLQGTTALLTTQHLYEIDEVADRIVVMDDGRIVADGTPAQLRQAVGPSVLRVRVADPADRERVAALLAEVLRTPVERDADPAALRVRVSGDTRRAGPRATEAVAELGFAGFGIETFSFGRSSLDEVYRAFADRGGESEALATDGTPEVVA